MSNRTCRSLKQYMELFCKERQRFSKIIAGTFWKLCILLHWKCACYSCNFNIVNKCSLKIFMVKFMLNEPIHHKYMYIFLSLTVVSEIDVSCQYQPRQVIWRFWKIYCHTFWRSLIPRQNCGLVVQCFFENSPQNWSYLATSSSSERTVSNCRKRSKTWVNMRRFSQCVK